MSEHHDWAAYLFDVTTGAQIAKLLADDGAAGDGFGLTVAISGAIAIVGAPFDDDNGTNSGSAYLFDTATGAQIAKLLPSDGTSLDRFGDSVAISGTTAIVGAAHDDDNGAASGSAYLFDTSSGVQIAKLLPDDGADFDQFGNSVGISDATAIVGAWHDDNKGSAYLFDISDPANPAQLAKLLPDDGGLEGHTFGVAVAISGAVAVVGALFDNGNISDSGAAYLFDTATGQQIAQLLPDDGQLSDWFGQSVAITGSPGNETAIGGAYFDDDNGDDAGSAYLFDAASAPGTCPWDLDDNAVVGASDLLALLRNWGPCKGCLGDFDGDGNVDQADLVVLLANWGPCR